MWNYQIMLIFSLKPFCNVVGLSFRTKILYKIFRINLWKKLKQNRKRWQQMKQLCLKTMPEWVNVLRLNFLYFTLGPIQINKDYSTQGCGQNSSWMCCFRLLRVFFIDCQCRIMVILNFSYRTSRSCMPSTSPSWRKPSHCRRSASPASTTRYRWLFIIIIIWLYWFEFHWNRNLVSLNVK